MTSIKVLADSLNMQEDAPIEVYKEFMQDISEEIDRENTIISDLLTLVKMDNKDGGLTIESVSVNAMLERILKRLGPIARKEETDLVFESNREVTASVDEVKMTLALTNLIENGIKYNRRPGWVKVNLDADHQFVTIVISDSGIGIPEDAREHIFERFYRVDKSHSREIGGTGLGLPITRKILLLHRGSIKVESVMGEGTTFTVRFPITYIG
jgi:signal transduction histidine kinase